MDTNTIPHHELDIPDFLRVTDQAARNATWKGKRCKSISKGTGSVTRLKVEDAQTRAFRKQLEKEKKAKQAARFKMLRERATEAKRKAVQR